jgi:hypothetical protein
LEKKQWNLFKTGLVEFEIHQILNVMMDAVAAMK